MTVLTTSNGHPIEDNQHSLTAGPQGPLLIQDFHLLDKLGNSNILKCEFTIFYNANF